MDEALAPRRLRELPSWLAARVTRAGARLVGAELDRAGLRRMHYALLVALRERGTCSQAQLGRLLDADRSDLHAAVTHLERLGYVAREPDPDDGRRKRVLLTPEGEAALRALDARVDAAQAQLLAPLTERQSAELIRLLRRVVDHHGA